MLETKETVAKEGLIEYKNGKFKRVCWKEAYEYCHQYYSDGSFREGVIKGFWDILLNEGVVSLEVHENYSLVAGSDIFAGPRDPISAMRLYFVKVEDAEMYQKHFLKNHQYVEIHHTEVVKKIRP